jgi:hypothetical protein
VESRDIARDRQAALNSPAVACRNTSGKLIVDMAIDVKDTAAHCALRTTRLTNNHLIEEKT